MTTKADFSVAEWETLRDAPNLVVLAVATAGASGIFGSIAEAFAPAGVFFDVLKGNNDLLKAICQHDELKASTESIKGLAKSSGDFASIQAALRKTATDKSKAAVELLKQNNDSNSNNNKNDFLRKVSLSTSPPNEKKDVSYYS